MGSDVTREKKYILIMMLLMILFSITFFIAIGDLNKDESLFNIGIPALFENWMIIILSIGSIIKIIVEFLKK